MGTLYYAFNKQTCSAYSLGKNSYFSIHENADTLSLEDRVALQYEGNVNFTRADTDAIAAALKAYEPFDIVPDFLRCDPVYQGCLITGSRFGPDDSDIGTSLYQDER